MSAKNVFGIVVRTVGLLLFLLGCNDVLIFLYNSATYLPPPSQHSWVELSIFGVAYMTTGFVLMREAKTIVAFTYPNE